MAQETFEEFSRRVSYSVIDYTEPGATKQLELMCSVKLPFGGFLSVFRPLYIIDALSDEQKAQFLVLKARQGANRLWEAMQVRKPIEAE
jgi:hypothetical protein